MTNALSSAPSESGPPDNERATLDGRACALGRKMARPAINAVMRLPVLYTIRTALGADLPTISAAGGQAGYVVEAAPVSAADADAYVRPFSLRDGRDPTACWLERVCPRVSGIADAYAEMVARRIRAVAREAGAPVSAEKCKPNVIVNFTYDSGLLLMQSQEATAAASPKCPNGNSAC